MAAAATAATAATARMKHNTGPPRTYGPVASGHAWAADHGYPLLERGTLTVRSNSRLYLVDDGAPSAWEQHSYVRIDLQRRPLSYTLDLSSVPCGCLACVYLVAMRNPTAAGANYCDMAENVRPGLNGELCVELDMLEANRVALQSAIHTELGGSYGSHRCDKNGCFARVGGPKAPGALQDAYGPGKLIDSDLPFDVEASVDGSGALTVQLQQGAAKVVSFDRTMAGNPQGDGVGTSALEATRLAQGKLALVASLWAAADLSWLDGGCGHCSIIDASYKLSNLHIGTETAPPPPPLLPPSLPPHPCPAPSSRPQQQPVHSSPAAVPPSLLAPASPRLPQEATLQWLLSQQSPWPPPPAPPPTQSWRGPSTLSLAGSVLAGVCLVAWVKKRRRMITDLPARRLADAPVASTAVAPGVELKAAKSDTRRNTSQSGKRLTVKAASGAKCEGKPGRKTYTKMKSQSNRSREALEPAAESNPGHDAEDDSSEEEGEDSAVQATPRAHSEERTQKLHVRVASDVASTAAAGLPRENSIGRSSCLFPPALDFDFD